MILRTLQELRSCYERLSAGDIYIGNLPPAPHKTTVLIDLMQRGVRLIPSPLARTLNTSKTAQAEILGRWMLPGTCVVSRRADLIEAARRYAQDGVRRVVTKQEGMHCGQGVRRWESMEVLYNVISLFPGAYPFVLQPFLEEFTDVRVIIVGEYAEAYTRVNPDNFRQNLAFGGTGRPFALSPELEGFCRSVMARGGFPFAHIDLQIVTETTFYLSEIALNGGISGAAIDRKSLDQKKQALLEEAARTRMEETERE